MAWANEPVVFTSLTIHVHVVNIVKVNGNNGQEQRSSANTQAYVNLSIAAQQGM